MQKANLVKTLKSYTSGWVSISRDYKKVIASGKTLNIVLRKLEKLGKPDGHLMKAAKDYSGYIGG